MSKVLKVLLAITVFFALFPFFVNIGRNDALHETRLHAMFVPRTQNQLPTFPGAMGGGAGTAGGSGRAGGAASVCNVTTLADSGTGSLRDCMTRSGPRTVIFRVAGCIPIFSQILVTNPYITIAGQTAPGQIIIGCATTTESLRFSTHDLRIQYLTFSPDNKNIGSGPSTGTVGFYVANTQAYNFMTDHITGRWAGNKPWLMFAGFAGEYNALTTMQRSIFYEPHEGHPVGPSTSEGDDVTRTRASHDIDFVQNMFINTDHRITEFNHSPMHWINNITYNYSWYAFEALGATISDVIGNIWDYNNLVPSQSYPIHSSDGNWPGSLPGTPSIYVSGNIGHGHSTPNADQWGDLTRQITGENGAEVGPMPSNWRRTTPTAPINAFPIQVLDATKLSAIITPDVGNSRHLDCHGNWVSHRDPEDLRIISQWNTRGTGGFWPNGVTFIGQPTFPTPTNNWTDHPQTGFTLCTESQHDGIPDLWKTDNGLSTTDPLLWSKPAPNGYTYLENYLNGNGATVVTPPPASGRPDPPTSVVATPH